MTYNISPLENYVKSYLKQHNRTSAPTIYVNKAIAIITAKLNGTCCSGSNATINLYTKRDNTLTIFVESIVNTMEKAGNVASLKRTLKLLNSFIGFPCCTHLVITNPSIGAVNFTFSPNYTTDVNNYTVSLFSSSTNVKFGSTITFSSNLNQGTLSGGFTSVPTGTYYINLVTNYNYNRPSRLLTSPNITTT